MGEELFELEGAYDRSELAGLFEELADAFAAGRPAKIDGDGTRVAFDPPERASVELELERNRGEEDDAGDSPPPTIEFEVELEWDDAPDDDSGVQVESVDAEETGGDGESTIGGASDDGSASDDGDDESATPDAASEATAGTESSGEADGRRARYEVYQDRADEWRWRLVHWNGNIIADSGEGYTTKYNAERALRSVVRNAPTATIEHLE